MESQGYTKTYPFEAIQLNNSDFVFIFREVKTNIEFRKLMIEGTRYYSILDCHEKHRYDVDSLKTSINSMIMKTADLETQISYHKLSDENIIEFIQYCQERFDFILEQIIEHFVNDSFDVYKHGLRLVFEDYINSSMITLYRFLKGISVYTMV
jgi:hypothetical protein